MEIFIWLLIAPIVVNGAPLNYTDDEFISTTSESIYTHTVLNVSKNLDIVGNNAEYTVVKENRNITGLKAGNEEESIGLVSEEFGEMENRPMEESLQNITEYNEEQSNGKVNTTVRPRRIVPHTHAFRELGSDATELKGAVEDSFVENVEKLISKDAKDANNVDFKEEDLKKPSKKEKNEKKNANSDDMTKIGNSEVKKEVQASVDGKAKDNNITSSIDIIERIKDSMYGREDDKQNFESLLKENADKRDLEHRFDERLNADVANTNNSNVGDDKKTEKRGNMENLDVGNDKLTEENAKDIFDEKYKENSKLTLDKDKDMIKTENVNSNDEVAKDTFDEEVEVSKNIKTLNDGANMVKTEKYDFKDEETKDTFDEKVENNENDNKKDDNASKTDSPTFKEQRNREEGENKMTEKVDDKEMINDDNSKEEEAKDTFDEKVEDDIAVDPDDSSFRRKKNSDEDRDATTDENKTNLDDEKPSNDISRTNIFSVNETSNKGASTSDSRDADAEEGNIIAAEPTAKNPVTQDERRNDGEFNDNSKLSTTPSSVSNDAKTDSNKVYSSAVTAAKVADEYLARTENMENNERFTDAPSMKNRDNENNNLDSNRNSENDRGSSRESNTRGDGREDTRVKETNNQRGRPAIACERSALCVNRRSASDEYQQHPDDSSYFYTCKTGLPLCLSCPTESLSFSEKCQMCMEKAGDEACPTTRPIVTKPVNENEYVCNKQFCSGKMNGHFANSEQIDQFYMCSNGITYCMNCPASLTFDEKCVRCVGVGDVGKDCGDNE